MHRRDVRGERRVLKIRQNRDGRLVRPRSAGGIVVATETGVVLLDDHDAPTPLCEILTDPGFHLNEGGCDPQGRFWCGATTYDDLEGACSLYRVEANGSFATALSGITCSNGLVWSADGATAFYVDSNAGGIDAFAFDGATGALTDRRRFVEIEASLGLPDGLAIDEEDGLWVALWGGGAVHRYDARGCLSEVIELPVPKVTACTFGGPDGRTLYITTSRLGMSAEEFLEAGALFSFRAGVRGAAPYAFNG